VENALNNTPIRAATKRLIASNGRPAARAASDLPFVLAELVDCDLCGVTHECGSDDDPHCDGQIADAHASPK
jgi:hypothetical protein